MLNMNRATLLGHAGRDPEIRDLKKGGKAAVFTLATTEKWKDGDGNPAEATEWHRVVVYGPAVKAVGDAEEGRPGDGRGPDRDARIHRPGRATTARSPRSSSRDGRAWSTSWEASGRRKASRLRNRKRRKTATCGTPRHEPPARSSGRARLCGPAVVGRRLGAVLHRAVRQPDLGRVLGVPVSHQHRADHHRQRLGRARHAQPVLADLPLRLADPRIGLSLGVWEPARLVDATRAPWCFPNLGGLTIDPGLPAGRGRTGAAGGDGAKGSVWHAHYYMYPLLSWIGVLLDLGCLEGGGLDIAWASELDPAWLDDELTFLLNPEARCSPTCRRRPRALPTARPRPRACRSIRCSGARAARAGCIR